MRYRPEPTFHHGRPFSDTRVAVVLCNLGTPMAATAQSVRSYLADFLSDPRIVELPRLLWMAILHGIILRIRPARSAQKYASIWTPEGSPLRVWTAAQTHALQTVLQEEQGLKVDVKMAMRYGVPSVEQVLDGLKSEGYSRILLWPMYPQYSATTTASVHDAVARWSLSTRNIPEFRWIQRFHDHPAYIEAMASKIRRHWDDHGRGQTLVLSFHGVPEKTLHQGDPYHCECRKTARLLQEALGLPADQVHVTFQSRFGKAKWLEPATEPTLVRLAQEGVRQVDLFCPGFVSDCLETLEELDQEASHAFVAAGGTELRRVACLNADPQWIQALSQIAQQHLAGWPVQPAPEGAASTALDQAQARLQRAQALDSSLR